MKNSACCTNFRASVVDRRIQGQFEVSLRCRTKVRRKETLALLVVPSSAGGYTYDATQLAHSEYLLIVLLMALVARCQLRHWLPPRDPQIFRSVLAAKSSAWHWALLLHKQANEKSLEILLSRRCYTQPSCQGL